MVESFEPEARAWFLGEIKYLADRSPLAAGKVVETFRLARQNLPDYPKIGAVGLIPGTRRLVVSQYVLIARQRGNIVEIVAMRHARQGDSYASSEAER